MARAKVTAADRKAAQSLIRGERVSIAIVAPKARTGVPSVAGTGAHGSYKVRKRERSKHRDEARRAMRGDW